MRPDPADVMVCRIWDRLALIVSHEDAPAALELARELYMMEGRVQLSPIVDDPRFSPRGENTRGKNSTSVLTGIPIEARYPSRCATCGGSIAVHETCIYDRAAKKVAHDRDECGVMDLEAMR